MSFSISPNSSPGSSPALLAKSHANPLRWLNSCNVAGNLVLMGSAANAAREQRQVEFVTQEEAIRKEEPSSSKRAYLKRQYTIGMCG